MIERQIPDDTKIIANNIVQLLKKNGLVPDDDGELEKQFALVISNEPSFKSLVKSISN